MLRRGAAVGVPCYTSALLATLVRGLMTRTIFQLHVLLAHAHHHAGRAGEGGR